MGSAGNESRSGKLGGWEGEDNGFPPILVSSPKFSSLFTR
jgi:hypothetical protein